ncbi:MAG TPA: hypothetical protein VFB00_03900 [Terriglobales bacterium]|nr:hypothetical protein [Terriglobales bacterium]
MRQSRTRETRSRARLRLGLSLFLLLALPLAGQQRRRDPLSPLEVDKIRDSAMEPAIRLKLYLEFARARLDKLQQAHAAEKAADRAQQTHDALQDFLDIYDELNENVDTFADRGSDLRKALKPVIEADTEFGSKLRAFKATLANSKEDTSTFDFLLDSAIEAVDGGAKDHRSLLAEQEESFKHKKSGGHKEQ